MGHRLWSTNGLLLQQIKDGYLTTCFTSLILNHNFGADLPLTRTLICGLAGRSTLLSSLKIELSSGSRSEKPLALRRCVQLMWWAVMAQILLFANGWRLR